MSRFRKFFRLPPREQLLLLKATALLFSIRALLWAFPYPTVKPLVDRVGRETQRPIRFSPERLAWSVAAAAQFVPGGRHCLSQAIALQVLLARRGIQSRICFGFRRIAGAPLVAHAWVEHRDHVLIGGENLDRFVRLASPSHSTSSSNSIADSF